MQTFRYTNPYDSPHCSGPTAPIKHSVVEMVKLVDWAVILSHGLQTRMYLHSAPDTEAEPTGLLKTMGELSVQIVAYSPLQRDILQEIPCLGTSIVTWKPQA